MDGPRDALWQDEPLYWLVNRDPYFMVYYNPYMGVSKNRGITKSSILIGFSIINHPFWSTIIFGNTHITG